MKPSPKSFRGLFGDGGAAVIGTPRKFDLCASIQAASEIRLATAFAHMSGWHLISESIRRSSAKVRLMTGLDFCQTDPKVLRQWLRLAQDGRASVRLYLGDAHTFHPKVLIVSCPNSDFAIVGSGNLSAGGLRDNIECSVFLTDKRLLRDLEIWFDLVFGDERNARQLTVTDIREYESKHKKAQKPAAMLRKVQHAVQTKLGRQHQGELLRWQQAVAAARKYFTTRDFYEWYPRQKKKAAQNIRRFLHYPSFYFSREDWEKFYAEPDLGRLRPAWMKHLWKHHIKLQNLLRLLIDENLPIADRLSRIMDPDGDCRLHGVGFNLISKVLAIHAPKRWPVYNKPVADTLRAFGYHLPHGMRPSARYLAFAELMLRFMDESDASDMLALDCFFYWYSRCREKP